jgi:L-amino acid N-acyltransferase YncA
MNDPSMRPRSGAAELSARPGQLCVRPAAAADFAAIHRIYAHHVENGTGSFEEVPPDIPELLRRWEQVAGRDLPYLIAETAQGVQGFAYAAPFRPRSAYRFTVEDSVYVDPGAVGLGLGRSLLAEVIARSSAQGYRRMVAVIGDSTNVRSIALHRSLGFSDAGTLTSVGRKFDRWIDVVFMQRALATGPIGL